MRTAKSSGQIDQALIKSSAYKDQPTDLINRLSVPTSYPDQSTVKSNRLSEVIGYQNPNVDKTVPILGPLGVKSLTFCPGSHPLQGA